MQWQSSFPDWNLPEGQIHLWRIFSPVDSLDRLPFAHILNPQEQKRARRFHFEKDRLHFAFFRGFLRILLGRYLGSPPESVSFLENAFGKPYLKPLSGQAPLFFNLSHSDGAALLALSSQVELGVDIEQIKERTDGEGIARRFFAPVEQDFLNQFKKEERVEAFFQLWTRKEAYLKALGKGFSKNLMEFQVVDDRGQLLTKIRETAAAGEPWEVRSFEVFPNYLGALVFPSSSQNLRFFGGSSLPDLQNL